MARNSFARPDYENANLAQLEVSDTKSLLLAIPRWIGDLSDTKFSSACIAVVAYSTTRLTNVSGLMLLFLGWAMLLITGLGFTRWSESFGGKNRSETSEGQTSNGNAGDCP